MRSNEEHHWSKSDDLVAFYLSRHGADLLGVSLLDVSAKIGIPVGTLKMRMSNYRSQEQPGGLSNIAKQSQAVFERHRAMSETELRPLVLQALS